MACTVRFTVKATVLSFLIGLLIGMYIDFKSGRPVAVISC